MLGAHRTLPRAQEGALSVIALWCLNESFSRQIALPMSSAFSNIISQQHVEILKTASLSPQMDISNLSKTKITPKPCANLVLEMN